MASRKRSNATSQMTKEDVARIMDEEGEEEEEEEISENQFLSAEELKGRRIVRAKRPVNRQGLSVPKAPSPVNNPFANINLRPSNETTTNILPKPDSSRFLPFPIADSSNKNNTASLPTTKATTATTAMVKKKKPKKIKLSYFGLEGSSSYESVFFALALTGIDFEVTSHDSSNAPQKGSHRQNPVLLSLLLHYEGEEEREEITTQTVHAMLRFLAISLAPQALYPPELLVNVEEVIGLVQDFFANPRTVLRLGDDKEVPPTDPEQLATWKNQDLIPWCQTLQSRLEKGGFIAGSHPTLADCVLVPRLNSLAQAEGFWDSLDQLREYVQRFRDLPVIRKSLETIASQK